jgi:hypothetical protein
MGFFSFLVLLAIAYLIWRVTDQLPDLIYRLSEIQRDVADLRRRVAGSEEAAPSPAAAAPPPSAAPPSSDTGQGGESGGA